MKSLILIAALFFNLAAQAGNDSASCSNPGYCTTIQFKKDSPVDYVSQAEVLKAVQNQCGEVMALTEKESSVSYNTDSGAIMDTIYKSVLTGMGFEVYVTLIHAHISNPTVENIDEIQVEGCK